MYTHLYLHLFLFFLLALIFLFYPEALQLILILCFFVNRVRLYTNVPGSLIINSSSKQPKKPPISSTKVADASPEHGQEEGKLEAEPVDTSSPLKDEDNELPEMNVKHEEDEDGDKSKDSPEKSVKSTEDDTIEGETVVLVHSDGGKENIQRGKGEVL